MTRLSTLLAVCVVAWFSASVASAEPLLYQLARLNNCGCSGCCDSKAGCASKGAKDKGYAPGDGIVDGPQPAVDGFGLLASNTGAVPGALSAAPAMVGDLLGFGGALAQASGNHTGTTIPIAGGDRRFKISDNMSPIPTNRLFFNYHHFAHGVSQWDTSRKDLDRFVFGVEKTFWGGSTSLELRLPLVSGLDADQGTTVTNHGTEFGNISLIGKTFLWNNSCAAITGGLALTLPTARDAREFNTATGAENFSVENDAVFLQPFLGCYYAPTDRLFAEGFMALDFDTGGYRVIAGGNKVGKWQEQNLMYVDFLVGYWVYQNPCGTYLQGIAPLFETHYTTTMNDGDTVATGVSGTVGNSFNRVDIFNITGGLLFQLTDLSSLRVAGVVPITERPNRSFDSELAVQYIRRY